MKHLLEIDSVILVFRNKMVLNDVYLRCKTGEVIGLLGRNGTGKSSLLKILYGELGVKFKSVRLNNNTLNNRIRRKEDMTYLPQHHFIPKSLRILSVFKHFRIDIEKFQCDFPDFKDLYNSKIGQLSSGQIRIIEVYLILMSKSKFSLLDEPFTHIMPKHVEKIKNIIELVKYRKGIVITDHLFEDVKDISNQIYLAHEGRVFNIVNPNDLIKYGYIL